MDHLTSEERIRNLCDKAARTRALALVSDETTAKNLASYATDLETDAEALEEEPSSRPRGATATQ
jgi:hypothetical protein